ncbi:MAG: alpha/beta fold hydrolase [Actinomycetota bacterium]|nr:alpha/beta fold hydrolase [Actinomycetota bacterium]
MRLTARTQGGLAYEAAGRGADVLLMHAGLSDARMWDPQWGPLSQGFHAIRYDARGFGSSVDPTRPYTLHGDGMDVLGALDVESAAVVGCSMGAYAALDMAIALPHRVSALVVVSGTPSGWAHTADILAQWEAVDTAYEQSGIDAANELEMKMWLDGPSRSPDAVDSAVRRSVASVNRVLLERQSAFEIEPGDLEPAAADRLGEVEVPVLIVTGELDQPSVLAGSFEIARGTGAEHVEIAGAAHFPNLEKPAEFNQAILDFLERSTH